MTKGLGDALAEAMSTVVDRVLAYLPNIVGAIALLLAGWILARLLRAVTLRAARLLDNTIARLIGPGSSERLRLGSTPRIAASIVFWVVLLFFATAATQVLGLSPFTSWLSQFVAYLPTLAAGILIVAAGYVFSRIASDLVRSTAPGFSPAQRATLARLTQATILAGAILIGADQIGIEVTFLVIFVAATAVAIAGGVALSVGLGARDYVANLIGSRQLRRAIAVGQTLRVGDFEGRVIDITATAVVLETATRRVSVPARVCNEQPVIVLKGDSDDRA